jgi:gliding motility-associated-like protein
MPTMKKITLLLLFMTSGLISLVAQNSISISGQRCVDTDLVFSLQTSVTPDSYNWNFGDGHSTSDAAPVHQYSASGAYSLSVVFTVNGNTNTVNSTLTVFENPLAGFVVNEVDYTSYARSFTDTTNSLYRPLSYTWSFNDQSDDLVTSDIRVYHKFPAAGTYDVILKVTDNNGCSDTALHQVTTTDLFMVPNVFTPNHDELNDEFIVTSNGMTLFSIEIFNRWGNRVFRRNNVEQIIWDGFTPEGSMVSPGTYFYIIIPSENGTTYKPLNGFITIFY